jgi:hypothetical protein
MAARIRGVMNGEIMTMAMPIANRNISGCDLE